MIKKLLLLFLLIVVFSIFVLPVLSMPDEKAYYPKSIMITGDSISTGYGLEGYGLSTPENDFTDFNYLVQNYGMILKNKYALSKYTNCAIDGITSTDLIDILSSGDYDDDIKNSEYVIISIGGNDCLNYVYKVIGAATGLGDNYTIEDIKNIDFADKQIYKNIISFLASHEISEMKATAINNFNNNFSAITEYIYAKNPNTKIIYQTVFNPFINVKNAGILDGIAESLLKEINKIIKENNIITRDDKSVQLYYYVDVYEAFMEDTKKYTNINSFDIHPNAEGHKLISVLLDNKIKDIYFNSIQQAHEDNNNETSKQDTTPSNIATFKDNAKKNYKYYLIFAAGIVVISYSSFIIAKRKLK